MNLPLWAEFVCSPTTTLKEGLFLRPVLCNRIFNMWEILADGKLYVNIEGPARMRGALGYSKTIDQRLAWLRPTPDQFGVFLETPFLLPSPLLFPPLALAKKAGVRISVSEHYLIKCDEIGSTARHRCLKSSASCIA